ncbi:MAG: hypothetical protein AAB770_00570 [Patescibacteria group bacterium]
MDTEETTQNESKKKFLIIALVAVLVVVGVLFVKKWYMPKPAETKTAIATKRVYTHEERMKILTDLSQAIPKDTTSQVEKMRILSNLSKKVPIDGATSTAEKLKILEALAANAR